MNSTSLLYRYLNLTLPTVSKSYGVFQILLYVEFLGFVIALLEIVMLVYLIVKCPQFHVNLIGLAVNMVLVFCVIAMSRLLEIILNQFDPYEGKIHDPVLASAHLIHTPRYH